MEKAVTREAETPPLKTPRHAHVELDWDQGNIRHIPSWVQTPILSVAQMIGFPSSIIVFVFMQLVGVVVGGFHRRFKSTQARHIYSIAFGSFFLFTIFGRSTIHMFILSGMVYILIPLLPLDKLNQTIFVISMTYLAACHIYNMVRAFGVWTVDISAPLMILTLKLFAFSQNYGDGQRLKLGQRLHDKAQLHDFYKEQTISAYPSVLEFGSFCLFYATLLSGPFIEMKPYLRFIDQSMFQQDGFSSAPDSLQATLLTVGKAGMACILIFISRYFPLAGYINSDQFIKGTTFLYRLSYLCIAVMLYRSKFYFSWYLSDASCQASGFGYYGVVHSDKEGAPKKIKWNRHDNGRIARVEFARNIHAVTDNWNASIGYCLKHYVYLRVSVPAILKAQLRDSKGLAIIITRMTSAVWHGFYPSYYVFFISMTLVNEFDKHLRNHFHPRTVRSDGSAPFVANFIYNAFSTFMTFSLSNYFGVAFTLLHVNDAIDAWSSVYWCGHIFCIVFVAICSFIPTPHKRKTI